MRRVPSSASPKGRELAALGPFKQMSSLLAEAREEGMDFESAWTTCLALTRFEHDTEQRRLGKAILEEHRDIWRSAFEREPGPPAMRAVLSLVAVLD